MPVIKMSDCLFEREGKLYFTNGSLVLEIPPNIWQLSEEIWKLRQQLEDSMKVVEAAKMVDTIYKTKLEGNEKILRFYASLEELNISLKELDGDK